MARVPLVSPESANEAQRQAFEDVSRQRGVVYNLFRAMAHSPEATRRVGAVGAMLRFDCGLPGRLREAVTLAVAARWGCDYELQQHRRAARVVGLDEATVTALIEGHEPAALDALETAAVRYARALCRDGRVDDALVEPLRASLDAQRLVELNVLVGYYSLLAMFLNGMEVDLEP